jgi:hypothetical protein
MSAEAAFEGTKRSTFKEALLIQYGGWDAFAKKLSILAYFGAHMAGQVPQGCVGPGEELPPYKGGLTTQSIRDDCTNALAAGQPITPARIGTSPASTPLLRSEVRGSNNGSLAVPFSNERKGSASSLDSMGAVPKQSTPTGSMDGLFPPALPARKSSVTSNGSLDHAGRVSNIKRTDSPESAYPKKTPVDVSPQF